MEFACGFVYVSPLASQKDSPRSNGPFKRSGGIFFLNSKMHHDSNMFNLLKQLNTDTVSALSCERNLQQ